MAISFCSLASSASSSSSSTGARDLPRTTVGFWGVVSFGGGYFFDGGGIWGRRKRCKRRGCEMKSLRRKRMM